MKFRIAWFELIPTLTGDTYAMGEHGPYIYKTKEEVLKEIKELEDDHRQQVWNGERDPDDVGIDSYPVCVKLYENGKIIQLDESNNETEITALVAQSIFNNINQESVKKYLEDIKAYVNTSE